MNANTLGILNLMSRVVNDEHGTSDYVITKYLLENLKQLEEISIYDIVDNVHVSRSSVRRYALRMGYDNFSEFKSSFNDIAFPSNIHLRDYYSFSDYKAILDLQITLLIQDLSKLYTDDVIHNLCSHIKSSSNVYIVCPNNTASTMEKFQQELMYAEKLIEVVSSKFTEGVTKTDETESNLFIVISVSGVFSTSINDYMNNVSGRKILLTANQDPIHQQFYDDVLFLSSSDVIEDKLGLIGKYGVTYVFDLISQYYIYSEYKKKE